MRRAARRAVALHRFSAAAGPGKERISTTLAKIASPSKSGSLAFGADLETMRFDSFYF